MLFADWLERSLEVGPPRLGRDHGAQADDCPAEASTRTGRAMLFGGQLLAGHRLELGEMLLLDHSKVGRGQLKHGGQWSSGGVVASEDIAESRQNVS